MEGAQADEFAAAADKLHPPADDFGKRDTLAQLVEETGWKGHQPSAFGKPGL
jgi:hypothetical protein